MITAALTQKNKQVLRKQMTDNEEDDTPIRRKHQLKFNALNLIDFNDLADQEDQVIENLDQQSAGFRMNSNDQFASHENQSIKEENESDDSDTTSKNNDDEKPRITNLKLPKLNVNVKRQSGMLNKDSLPEDVSQEEPQAEPMGDYNSPNQEKYKNQNQQIQSNPMNDNVEDSESEFDIFNPNEKSVDRAPQAAQEIDEKLKNLTQEANALERILPNFIINPYGKFRSYWSGMMILMLFYVVLILPVRLAFEQNTNEYIALDLTIDSIFFLDLVLTFFTAYEDERGIVIVEFGKIATQYLKGWFFIDLISTFPLYLILDSDLLQGAQNVNGLLRLARLPRLYKLVGVLRVGNLIKHQVIQKLFFFLKLNKEYSLILKFIIITFVVIHLAGCFWYFVGSISDDNTNWIIVFELADKSAVEQYIASVYFVLTILVTVGYGNILPTNNVEYILAIVFQFLGVAFFAYVMGTLTFTFAKLSQKLTMIKEREIFFNELAHTYSLPKETHERLLMSVQNSIFSHSNQMLEFYNEEEIIQDLPPLVQGMICEFVFKDIIEKIRFFNGKPRGFLRRIFKYMIPTFLNKGDAIFFKGEPADYIYYVIRGRLVTKCEDQFGRVRTLVHVEGSYFGEVDILVSRARGESAIAETQAEVWKIAKEHFMRILNDYEDVKMEVLDHAISKEKSRKNTVKIAKNKEFLDLIAISKKDRITMNKQQFVGRVKEKVLLQLQEIVKSKNEIGKELFQSLGDLDKFLDKVAEYNKICSKLNITSEDLNQDQSYKPLIFHDPEVEESLLKGLTVQSHLTSIQEYL